MNEDCLKLTTYFGERDRIDGRFLADALMDVYARHELATSLVLRGSMGFGLKHHVRTDRLLSLSEDLPMVAVAVDTRERIEAALADVRPLSFDGLVTLERARMLTGRIGAATPPAAPDEATKLTVYLGRQERIGARRADQAVTELLHREGLDGASVLLGVDGTVRGARERAAFFGANRSVPLMVIAIGAAGRIASVLPKLGEILPEPLATLERVRVCKRDGVTLARPPELPQTDDSGLGVWQKLMVYASEQSRHDGRPLSPELVRALRAAGAAGATTLRGVWGYHGDHLPHGDSFWQLRRRVPAVTVIVDAPARIREWFAIVDEFTDEAGLVTSEMVPAFQATSAQVHRGGLRLADLRR